MIGWFIYFRFNVSISDCKLRNFVILCIIVGDVHQIIGNCIIPHHKLFKLNKDNSIKAML